MQVLNYLKAKPQNIVYRFTRSLSLRKANTVVIVIQQLDPGRRIIFEAEFLKLLAACEATINK